MFLTYDQAVIELQNAVRTRGERYVYPEEWRGTDRLCKYVYGDAQIPACIVGQVFSQLGLSVKLLDGRSPEPRTAGVYVDLEMDDDAASLLWFAQQIQDQGFTWGEAYGFAIAEVARTRGEHVPC